MIERSFYRVEKRKESGIKQKQREKKIYLRFARFFSSSFFSTDIPLVSIIFSSIEACAIPNVAFDQSVERWACASGIID